MGRNVALLLPRLRPGDIAVIDHMDLDRSTARDLVSAGVAGVVNTAASISGRYPNRGPEVLAEAGIAQVDMVGPEILTQVRNGDQITILDGNVQRGDDLVAAGRALHSSDIVQLMLAARRGLETQLQSLTTNTVEFLRREQGLILHGDGLPQLRTQLAGRPVLVVVAGFDYEADLRRVRRFVKEQRPVVIAVDAGADAAKRAGVRPDVVVISEAGLGSRTATGPSVAPVSDKAIRSAREVVLLTDLSGQANGADRLDKLGVAPVEVRASAAPSDIAVLLADVGQARLIVTAGVHATLDEFLDRHRSGMASTFLTHLRVGPKLVSAAALPQVYLGGARRWQLVLLVVAGVAAVAAALATTPDGADLYHWTWTHLPGVFHIIRSGAL
jgi:uncharacterized membrane-anchored protein